MGSKAAGGSNGEWSIRREREIPQSADCGTQKDPEQSGIQRGGGLARSRKAPGITDSTLLPGKQRASCQRRPHRPAVPGDLPVSPPWPCPSPAPARRPGRKEVRGCEPWPYRLHLLAVGEEEIAHRGPATLQPLLSCREATVRPLCPGPGRLAPPPAHNRLATRRAKLPPGRGGIFHPQSNGSSRQASQHPPCCFTSFIFF